MRKYTTKSVDRRTMLKLTGGAGIAGLAGCMSSSSSGNEAYNIGMVDAQTGSLSAFGERNQRGKDLALSAVNEVGIGES